MSVKGWLIDKAIHGKLPDWLYRLAGKKIEKKLEDNMNTKKWYASKTVWTAVIVAVVGAVQPISTALGHPITVPNWILEVLAGMGLYGLRTSEKPVA